MVDEGINAQCAVVVGLDPDPVHYPESDGRFLPGNTLQAEAVISVRNALDLHLEHEPNAVLEGNKFIYYEKGESSKWVAPDIYVLLNHVYKCPSPYKVWVERKAPDFVLEVISPESEIRNRVDEKALYAKLGVEEYFVFQPDEARGSERLLGCRLGGDEYVELEPDPESGPERELVSKTLGVSLRVTGPLIRVRNVMTGEDYRSHREMRASIEADRQRAKAAKERAKAARRQAKAARERADAARQRGNLARQRADAAKAEVAALKALLADSGRQVPSNR